MLLVYSSILPQSAACLHFQLSFAFCKNS
uniref:Uncharacterized protein n=1 Tax=Arundo donax TaxID=35708 RepID=A0A0A8Y6J9_ARUDO